MNEQEAFDAKMMEEIQELLGRNKHLPEFDQTTFSRINEQLRNQNGPIETTILESRTVSAGHRFKSFRIGFGFMPEGSQLYLKNNRIVVPINPHLHWRNATFDAQEYGIVNEPFWTVITGTHVLDDDSPMSLEMYKRLPVNRKFTRVMLTTGDDAKDFIMELGNSFGLPMKIINDFKP